MVLDIKSQSPKPKMKKNKLEALEWFKLENEDFKTVCSLAGYDPEWIEKCFKNAQKRGFQWRKSSKTLLNITFPNIMNYKKGQQIDLFIVLQ